MTTLVIVIPHHPVGPHRCLHPCKRRKQRIYILTTFLIIAAHQEYIRFLGNQQTNQIIQPFLFQQTLIMQIGDKSDAKTLEGFGNVPVGKVIFHDTIHPWIDGGNVHFGRSYFRTAKYPILRFICISRRFIFLGSAFPTFRNVQIFELRVIRSKQSGYDVGRIHNNGVCVQNRTRQGCYHPLFRLAGNK